MEYAIVGKLKLQEIEGAKTLQMGRYGGLPFAVGKDITEDELVLIFLPDGKISEAFAKEHDLVGYTDPNTGKKKGGFLAKNRKVRTIKLMQGKIRSVGLVMKLDSLAFTGYNISSLREGDSFNELNGVQICSKFLVNKPHPAQKAKQNRREVKGMPMHPDTNQFYKFANTIKPGDIITITLKLDGTSVRVANAYKELKWYHKLFLMEQKTEHVVGTRRVIINNTTGNGYYNDNHGLYKEAVKELKLSPGEALYGEIVGWRGTKPLFKRGGVTFKYGCPVGTTNFYVYNIKWTLPNGTQIDLPWGKIKERCWELGVMHVPEMVVPEYNSCLPDGSWISGSFVYDGNLAKLEKSVYSLVDGPDLIDPSHIREGVVLRVESNETKFYKAKSEAFYALEDKAKSKEDFVDLEEQ